MFAKYGQEDGYLTGDCVTMNKAKIMYYCMVNLAQAQDNNANGFHAKAYLLWDFYHSI